MCYSQISMTHFIECISTHNHKHIWCTISYILFLFLYLFRDRVVLCSPGKPWTWGSPLSSPECLYCWPLPPCLAFVWDLTCPRKTPVFQDSWPTYDCWKVMGFFRVEAQTTGLAWKLYQNFLYLFICILFKYLLSLINQSLLLTLEVDTLGDFLY